MSAPQRPADFLSGTSGEVTGVRATTRARLADAGADAVLVARRLPRRLARAAATQPIRRILSLSIERAGEPNLLAQARRELERSRHVVTVATTDAGERGKFENLNRLLAQNPLDGYDWVLVVDDDVALPRGFLDGFIYLAERFSLALAQPAHRHRSHAAWSVTRRRAMTVVRETAFVEIGPVTAFSSATFETLLPFPPLRVGWGLDGHWSALARERGWRIGVVDATPVLHGLRRVATHYAHAEAIAEARTFLDGRPYTSAVQAQRTLTAHRSWR